MKLTDTHSHLYDTAFDADREEALARAAAAGVEHLLLPGIDSESHGALFDLCRRHPGQCVPMMGLHPTSVNDNPHWREELALAERYLTAPPESIARFCAVGEIGLDYYWSGEFVAEQVEAFVSQCRLADGIEVIKLFPGLGENILRAMLSAPGLRAVVLETFGAGNAPTNEWFIRVLKEAIDRGVIILNITQCGGGKVSMELYETGLRLQKIGVLCGHDMTTEAAVTKLMYVLGLGLSDEQTRALLRRPLRGEFTA